MCRDEFAEDNTPQVVLSLIINHYICVEMVGVGQKHSYIGGRCCSSFTCFEIDHQTLLLRTGMV